MFSNRFCKPVLFRPPAWSRLVMAGLVIAAVALTLILVVNFRQVNWAVLDSTVSKGQISFDDMIRAGWWIAGMGTVIMLVVLAALLPWWGRKEAIPLLSSGDRRGGGKLRLKWFVLWLGLIVITAGIVRWPCMGLSFWGDESWQFCDYVHGKWKPLMKGGDPQDGVQFKQVSWKQTFLGDQSANNHWMASVMQRSALTWWRAVNGKQPWEFDERVVRSVSLFGGLGSLIALAFWMRSINRCREGLLATVLMSLHPWHVRFSFEARGYGLMLMFLILMLWALTQAVQKGRKRDWIRFGISESLLMFAWKGVVHPLVMLNLTLLGCFCWWLLTHRNKQSVMIPFSRWVMASCVGAILIMPLAVPSQLQVRKEMTALQGRAKPMNEVWFRNTVSEALLGIPQIDLDPQNPHGVSMQRLSSKNPLYQTLAWGMMVLPLFGWISWWRRREFVLLMSFMAIAAGAMASMMHFKYVMQVELLSWYWLYVLPVLACLSAGALKSGMDLFEHRRYPWLRHGFVVTTIMVMIWFWKPMVNHMQTFPREDHRSAWLMTRGKHEAPGYSGPSNIFTAWLWRHVDLYDPRGDKHVRTAKALMQKMEQAKASDGEFYMIIGDENLCQLLCDEMMGVLRNPELFDQQQTFWGVEPLNKLTVYHMRKSSHMKMISQDSQSQINPSQTVLENRSWQRLSLKSQDHGVDR